MDHKKLFGHNTVHKARSSLTFLCEFLSLLGPHDLILDKTKKSQNKKGGKSLFQQWPNRLLH